MKVNKTFVKKLTKIIDAGLCSGLGTPTLGQMCVEAAVCYARNLPHGDKPTCVHQTIRSFMINLNDASWSSNEARAAGLKRLAIAQLGTSDSFDEKFFVEKMAMYAINKNVPLALRATLNMPAFPEKHKEKLETAAVNCESAKNLSDGKSAASAANAAASAAAYAAANATANAAANATAYAAYGAAYAAANAAYAAANAAYAAAYAAEKDQILIDTANYALEVLIEMKTKGSEFLYLLD